LENVEIGVVLGGQWSPKLYQQCHRLIERVQLPIRLIETIFLSCAAYEI